MFKNKFEILTTPLNFLNSKERFILKALLFLFSPFIRVENEKGLPPADEPVIFAFNHNSSFETVLIALVLIFKRQGKKVHFLVDWMYGYLPIVGWLVRLTDPIFVFNKQARFRWLNRIKYQVEQKNVFLQCIQKLNQNGSIGIFPEGTRNRNPHELKIGQNGIGRIALKTGVPVVPIGIDFPKRIKYGKIPKIGSTILRVGEKMTFSVEYVVVKKIIQSEELSLPAKNDAINYLEARVTYQIMLELSKLCGKKYPFNPPEIPQQSAWYINEILNSGEILCHELKPSK